MGKFTPFLALKPGPLEDNLKVIFRELQKDLLAYYELEATVNGDTVIDHKLGRQPRGWILIDTQDANVIKRVSWDDKHITLNASSSTRCKLLIY